MVRGDVHHGRDGAARTTHRIVFEESSHLVEEHHRRALGHVRLGLGKEHQGKGADGGDGHEQVLVEGLPVDDAVPGLGQHVVSGQQIRDEKCRELNPEPVAA